MVALQRRVDRPLRTHARTPNEKEKFNGRKIHTTLLYRSVREIPFGIDKNNGSHAQRTLRFATVQVPVPVYQINSSQAPEAEQASSTAAATTKARTPTPQADLM